MRFHDILPHLLDAYRRGVLVPFIGSGLSRPACRDWPGFLLALAAEAGLAVSAETRERICARKASATELYRLADLAVRALRGRSTDDRADAYRRALSSPGETGVVPPQSAALARIHWPLVLTTNYDDLFIAAREARPVGSEAVPEILGRSVDDGHRVIRSLDTSARAILWALQGFLGGQATAPEAVLPDVRRRRELAEQVVVGHQQYQAAINGAAPFRRAFAEVFQRRSFLFIGSGILEDYLVNLFGEILHHYGPGRYPHFALAPESERAALDPKFLQTRLGIVPLFYERYDEIPAYLDTLADLVQGQTLASPVAWIADEIGFALTNGVGSPPSGARRIVLRYAPLRAPERREGVCSIASVGRDPENQPLLGHEATALVAAATAAGDISPTSRAGRESTPSETWHSVDAAPSYVFRLGDAPLLAVAARVRGALDDGAGSGRDLGIIPEAVVAALRAADAAGFHTVHLGPLASGKARPWHPLHPFIQSLVGVRQYFGDAPSSRIHSLAIHVVDPSVWSIVVAGKIPVSEVLSSDVTRIWVDVRDPENTSEFQAVTVRGAVTVGAIKDLCGLPRERWTATLSPRPTRDAESPDGEDAMAVAPASFLTFTPRLTGSRCP